MFTSHELNRAVPNNSGNDLFGLVYVFHNRFLVHAGFAVLFGASEQSEDNIGEAAR